MTLAEIDRALACALPVLPAGDGRSPIATCFAARRKGRTFVIGGGERVPLSSRSRTLLSLRPLGGGLFETDSHQELLAVDLDGPTAALAGKLALRGFPSDLTRVDNDDGTIRWRSLSLTGRVRGERELLLDEPDSIATFDNLIGAPVFLLPREGLPKFAGVIIDGEKRSILGRATLVPASELVATLDAL
jgi:hypothetical protein